MPLHHNVGGTWKSITPWVNVGGVWKKLTGYWINVAGVWKQILVLGPPDPPAGYYINSNFTVICQQVSATVWGWQNSPPTAINPSPNPKPATTSTSNPGVGNMFIISWTSTTNTLDLYWANVPATPNPVPIGTCFVRMTIKDLVTLATTTWLTANCSVTDLIPATMRFGWSTTTNPLPVVGRTYQVEFFNS